MTTSCSALAVSAVEAGTQRVELGLTGEPRRIELDQSPFHLLDPVEEQLTIDAGFVAEHLLELDQAGLDLCLAAIALRLEMDHLDAGPLVRRTQLFGPFAQPVELADLAADLGDLAADLRAEPFDRRLQLTDLRALAGDQFGDQFGAGFDRREPCRQFVDLLA